MWWFQKYEYILCFNFCCWFIRGGKYCSTVEMMFWNVPTMFIVLKTYQMFTYLISAYKGDYKMTICFLKSDSYKKTVIFNGFLTYFKIGFFFAFLISKCLANHNLLCGWYTKMFQFTRKDLLIKPSLLKIDIFSMVRFVPPIKTFRWFNRILWNFVSICEIESCRGKTM